MERKKKANNEGKVSVRGAEFDRQDGEDGQKRSEVKRGGRYSPVTRFNPEGGENFV